MPVCDFQKLLFKLNPHNKNFFGMHQTLLHHNNLLIIINIKRNEVCCTVRSYVQDGHDVRDEMHTYDTCDAAVAGFINE